MTGVVSTAPAVLDKLVEVAKTALPDVQVLDGVVVDTADDLLVIGFAAFEGEASVTSTQTPEGLAAQPDREAYDVTCLASSWSGVKDAKTVRDRAYAIVNGFAEAVAADRRLGGLVMSARVSAQELIQALTDKGVVADVSFTVHIDAFTA